MKPNIVFILSDDQGAWALNCAGTKELITPNIDNLAKEGMRFENFFCNSPVCSPARASIITGKMPSAHGIHDWLCGGNIDTEKYPHMREHEHFKSPDHAIEYLKGQDTYVSELAKAGYQCALSGKWHMGNSEKSGEGFSKWFTIGTGGCNYFHADIFKDHEFSIEKRYITDVITDEALSFLRERDKEAPFYLSVHYTAPHSPWTSQNHPEEYLKQYEDCEFESVPYEPVHPNQIDSCPIGDTREHRNENLRGYFAAITAMDAGIGRIVGELKEQGLMENTVIIYTADNGMNMGHHGVWGKGNGTYPPNMYDSSVKVPFIITGPGIRKNVISEYMASHCDLFPTIMQLAQIDYKKSPLQTGSSFYDECTGNQGEEKQNSVVVCDEYGFVRMYRTSRYKLVRRFLTDLQEFYDLSKDPLEVNNLIDDPEYQEVIQELDRELETWFARFDHNEFCGKNLSVTGKGQKKWCYEKDAFRALVR